MDSYSISYRFKSYYHQLIKRNVAQLVAYLFWEQKVMRSNRIIPIQKKNLNLYMKQLHLLMCILLLLSSLLVILSNNPVESVLYLILTFCNAGTILFLFNLEFFGLIFIIIYVGAIAVLFLFVVMMINIKQESVLFTKTSTGVFFSAILILTIYIVLLNLYLCLFESVPNLQNMDVLPDSVFNTTIDNLNNIEVFGQVLYNFFLLYVPIAGFLLLIALIGSIVLTLNFNKQAKQTFSYKQLARTDNFISFFSSKGIKK